MVKKAGTVSTSYARLHLYELDDLTRTLVTKTARGIHLYFRWPPEGVPTLVKFMPGLDTRGRGSYALVPPSVHETGTIYDWLDNESNREILKAPPWLLAKICGYPRQPKVDAADLQIWPVTQTERTQ